MPSMHCGEQWRNICLSAESSCALIASAKSFQPSEVDVLVSYVVSKTLSIILCKCNYITVNSNEGICPTQTFVRHLIRASWYGEIFIYEYMYPINRRWLRNLIVKVSIYYLSKRRWIRGYLNGVSR